MVIITLKKGGMSYSDLWLVQEHHSPSPPAIGTATGTATGAGGGTVGGGGGGGSGTTTGGSTCKYSTKIIVFPQYVSLIEFPNPHIGQIRNLCLE